MMTIEHIKRLLAMAAARDNRTPSQAMARAWEQDLGDLEFADCFQAMNRHYRESADWIQPAHIRAQVRIIRDEKRRGSNIAALTAADPHPADADQRAQRVAGFAAACLEAAGLTREQSARSRDHDDPVRDQALARAAVQKREQERTDRNPALAGLVAKATRHIEPPRES